MQGTPFSLHFGSESNANLRYAANTSFFTFCFRIQCKRLSCIKGTLEICGVALPGTSRGLYAPVRAAATACAVECESCEAKYESSLQWNGMAVQ